MEAKVLQNAPLEHSAVLLTCIKISHGFHIWTKGEVGAVKPV